MTAPSVTPLPYSRCPTKARPLEEVRSGLAKALGNRAEMMTSPRVGASARTTPDSPLGYRTRRKTRIAGRWSRSSALAVDARPSC
jgi:hypothetical protein